MQKTLFIKLGTIALITLLLLIPIGLISDKIYERARFKDEAIHSVAQSWTDNQTLYGPFMVIPYTRTVVTKQWDKTTESYKENQKVSEHVSFYAPATLDIDAAIKDEIRARGIYEVPVYTANINVSGEFSSAHIIKELEWIKSLKGEVKFEKPIFVFGVTDPRGINQVPKLNWRTQSFEFLPGTTVSQIAEGVHVPLPEIADTAAEDYAFDFDISLRGIESLSFVPTGQNMNIGFQSKWQHPKFVGKFLPTSYTLDDSGYNAQWQVTSFATNINEILKKCAVFECDALHAIHFGVEHIQAVDVYLQSERSVKYGLLFVVLTFLTFFIIEIKNKMAIHPIQYVLVGAAITIFYLLLFALSEHLSFITSYGIASISCVAVIAAYITRLVGGGRRAGIFAGCLWGLYAILYVIVSAEDYALLMGAILTFALLSTLMLVTRNVDWFGVMNEFDVTRKDISAAAQAD